MTLQIAGRAFDSHLLLDSGGLPNAALLAPIIEAAEPALVTVSMRRTSSLAAGGPLSTIRSLGVPVLPNNAGCLRDREAVLTAELARERSEERRVGTACVNVCRSPWWTEPH